MIVIADKMITRAGREHRHGAIVVRSGKIIDTGSERKMLAKYAGHRVIRLDRSVLMPGLVNVHAHLELPPLLDRIGGKDYPAWVLNLLKAKSGLDMSDYVAASQNNIASAIRAGTTTVSEICTHDASPPVLAGSGLRAIIFREFISMDLDVRKPVLPRLDRPSRLMYRGLSPHSPHTVSEPALEAVRRYANKHRLPICMHVAETIEETRLLQGKKTGLERIYAAAGWDIARAPRARSPLEYLQRTGILGPTFLAVHAIHVDDTDISIIKRTGAGIAHCPRSNSSLRAGRMPLAEFLRARIPVGLGTDSLASVPTLSMWDEMRYALRIHRPSDITASDILRIATLGGANALGMGHEIGSLEPGKRADCIIVPLPSKDTGDLSADLLRETKSCIMNMVNGKIIYLQHNTRLKQASPDRVSLFPGLSIHSYGHRQH